MPLDPDYHLVIPRDKLKEAVKKAYELSQPVGMGILHYREGPLTDEEAQGLIDLCKGSHMKLVRMDYVHGRCCKLTIYRHPTDESLALIVAYWQDHTDSQLAELLTTCGVEEPAAMILEVREKLDA